MSKLENRCKTLSNHQGNLFVIAAPSGTGKTSLVRALINRVSQLEISISHTTRLPRPGDIPGQDYFFISKHDFHLLLEQKRFLEHAMIYDHYYGTSQEWTMEKLNQGIDVILEIDWQGARQIRQQMADAIFVFILPPSLTALHERLKQRNQDDFAAIAKRMASAQEEISHYNEFDYLIINESFDKALEELEYIIFAARLTCKRKVSSIQPLLQQLLPKL